MMDGVDGLAGGCVAVMLAWLALAAWLANLQGPLVVAVVTAAAVLGFLLHNLRGPWRAQASVFLGDAGSLSLGLIVIWLAIEISQAPSRVVSPMGIAWVVALPVLDTFSLLIRRLIHGQNPLKADRNHLHHLFGRAGFSPGQTAAALIVLSAALGGVGVLGSAIGVPDFVLGLGLLMVMAGHYLFVRYAWRTTRALKRLRASAGQLAPAERLGLVGLYAGMAGVALGEMALLALAAASIAAASVVRFRLLITDLRAISMSWIAAGLLLWLTLAALRGPDFSGSDWWPLLWASGVVALPLGWWFMRLRTHATGLFAVLLLSLIVAWGSSLEWRMLEAGLTRTPDYWGSPRSGGLLLGLVLMPLLAAIALSVGVVHRRWRARAALAFGVVLAGLTLLLLIASQSRVAIGAGALGLLAMVVGATLHRLGTRLWLGFISVSVAAVLMSSVLANTFKPPQVSLNAEYWAPVQSVLLLLANQPALAQDADPAVASQVATWQLAWQAIGERPLAGVGHLKAVGPSLGELAGERLSLYAIVGLVGGLTALALFLTLWLMALRALIGVVCARRWPLTQGFASYGVTAMIMGFCCSHRLSVRR
jgi:UDP-N-acetylmuramyl pentapeptide phosphotransferase/UDP-N-acetylglucosamine-1-phosphate transferase